MKKIGNWIWGVLAAVGGLAMALLCLARWWERRKTRGQLSATAEELAARHAEAAEAKAEADTQAAQEAATEAVKDAAEAASKEVRNESSIRSLSDYLRSRGAGR